MSAPQQQPPEGLVKVGELIDWLRGVGPDPRPTQPDVVKPAPGTIYEVSEEGIFGRFQLSVVHIDLNQLEEVQGSEEGHYGRFQLTRLPVPLQNLEEVMTPPTPQARPRVPSRFYGVAELALPVESLLEEIKFPSLSPPQIPVPGVTVPVLPTIDLSTAPDVEEVLLEDSAQPTLALLPWEPRIKVDKIEWMG